MIPSRARSCRHRVEAERLRAAVAYGGGAVPGQVLKRVQEPDGPDSLTARKDLTVLHGLNGDTVGTATAFADLLAHCERVRGPDHPDTLAARDLPARWRSRHEDRRRTAASGSRPVPRRERPTRESPPDEHRTGARES
ncbi:hypothetical protein OG875_00185 [Streptomyces sp. NBC_01498]|uniref:hypothetical protein n=1 Tax=Streptomyces sp. NBC_01498 TaxID=2975870 RepID=UPI002E7ACE15|nr:hypothetical protein [Streptomyces sp. NBC_01498]WTL23147.1 hypothetical protein OG875_00185 [Streptomyces sp. NBC_01498]